MSLPLSDEMLGRAARALYERSPLAMPAVVATSLAREVIDAAFDGVPLSNFGIGLALDDVDAVALYRGVRPDSDPGVVICVADPDNSLGLLTLAHRMQVQFGRGGRLTRLTISEIEC